MTIDLDQFVPHEEVLEQDLEDPEFRAEWEKTAVARWIATELAHYRAENDLTQRELAEHLGLQQSDVARMEGGTVTPSFPKLFKIVKGLGIEVMIDIHPEGKEATLPRKKARSRRQVLVMDGVALTMATA